MKSKGRGRSVVPFGLFISSRVNMHQSINQSAVVLLLYIIIAFSIKREKEQSAVRVEL